MCPGVIVSDLHERGGMSDEACQAFVKYCKTKHAFGRLGEATKVAATIA